MTMTILVAPSGFKESLSVQQVTDAIAAGVLEAMPEARVLKAPMVDGGEGFTEAIVAATGGRMHRLRVTGPVGDPVESFIGFSGRPGPRTAIIEMAAAAGLSLVPRDRRNPMLTTSFGVGEQIRAALELGAERIMLGCGDSGINDGGAGMAQALGVRLLDDECRELPFGGGALVDLAAIDVSRRDARLSRVRIDAAVNWHNVLLGERGVARVFGPQKGATPEQVVVLEQGMENYCAHLRDATGIDVGHAPGSGASGGLGAGLVALLGGTLHPRYDVVMQYLAFDELLGEADLAITAEGSLDGQSPYGKIPCEVGRRAKARGLPVVAIAGTIGDGVVATFDHGVDAFTSIMKRPCTLEEAIINANALLQSAAADSMRMVKVGSQLEARRQRDRSTGFFPWWRKQPAGPAARASAVAR